MVTSTLHPFNCAVKPSDLDYGASNRAERTPGAVAVSGGVRQDTGGGVNPLPVLPQTNSRCGAWAVLAQCESEGRIFGKRIVCGKEWCPDCGQDDSKAHSRRISRIIPKVQQIATLGYFVIEFPDRYRELKGWCYSKEALRKATDKVVEVFAGKRMGRRGRVGGYFSRGLIRWHWFGDKVRGKWNPHMNILVDSAFIEADKLELIKADLRSALKCPDLIVHYSFVDKPGQIYHKVHYVTRATFREYEWNPYMAERLFNFRNQRWWGSWKGEPVWNVESDTDSGNDFKAISNLQSGVCPCCGGELKTLGHNDKGQPVKWTKAIDSRWLDIWGAEEYGNSGYYQIPLKVWQGGDSLSPEDLIRLQELKLKAREKPSVSNVALLASRHAARHLREYENESWWQHLMQENLN